MFWLIEFCDESDLMAASTNLGLYGRLLGYVRPYWRVVAVSVLSMGVLAALEPMLPALMKPLVDESLIAKSSESIWHVPVLILLVFVGKGVADYVSNVSTQWVAQRVVADVRRQLFSHQLCLSLVDQQQEGIGPMMSRVTYDTQQISAAVSTAWLTVVRDTLVLIALVSYLFFLAWKLTLVVFLIAPVVAALIYFAAKKLKVSNQRLQAHMAKMSSVLQQAYQGVQEIKIFQAETASKKRFDQVSEDVRRESMKAIRIQAMNVPLVQIFAAVAVCLVLVIASYQSAQNQLTPGEFVAFVTALAMVFEPIRRLTNINAVIQRGMAAAHSIFEMLDHLAEISGNRDGKGFRHTTALLRSTEPFLRVEALTFSYSRDSVEVCRDVDLTIDAGTAVALVGQSGSGKTTLSQILVGLHRNYGGRILLNGRDAKELDLATYRSAFSMLSQQPALFDGTVAENIAMTSDFDSERVTLALQRAELIDFVRQLPNGILTLLGAEGLGLSGGQQQRLGLARALYHDAPCLVMDEATSALDPQNQRKIWELFRSLRGEKTLVLVAHQLDAIAWADQILVFDQGSVVERGRFDELRNRRGKFWHLLNQGAQSTSSPVVDD